MKPITREEQYLNRLTGEEGIIPDKPVTREEQYFARLCGGDNVIPDKPVTRREQYLATLCGEDVITPTKPVTRIEQYMAFASGESESKPEKPITREEMYWDKYQGGDVPEEKTIAFTDIITVTDALARPAVDLQAEITATQNLNGYEYPWVGGAGENLFYHEGNLNRTLNGLTATFDGATQTISIEGTNTGTSAYILLDIPCTGNIPRETPLSSAIFNAPNGVYPNFVYHQKGGWYAVGNGGTIPVDADSVDFQIGIRASVTTLNATGIRVQIQHGSTPAPWENICPISGRTEVNVTRTGKNLGKITYGNQVPSVINGQMVSYDGWSSDYIRVFPSQEYISTFANAPSNKYVFFYDINKNYLGYSNHSAGSYRLSQNEYWSKTGYLKVRADGSSSAQFTWQLELGSTAYEPYEGDTFNTELGRTVYGGTLDLTTGELKITHAYVDLGDFYWMKTTFPNVYSIEIAGKKPGQTNFTTTSYRTVAKGYADLANGEATSISLMLLEHLSTQIGIKDERATTSAEFTTLVTGQKMVYELATPQTISLTPTEVMMLENNNTIWADSGRVQLTYLSKAAERVQLMNASLKANTLKLTKGAIKE